MKQLITRLKIVLQSNWFYILLFFIVVIVIICSIFRINKSIYNVNEHNLNLIIKDYSIKDNKISFKFKGEEDLVGTYYVEDVKNIDNFKYGDEVLVKGDLIEPGDNTIPRTFNYKKYLKNKGINYSLNISDIKVIKHSDNIFYKFKNTINKRINENAYLKTFILGDKSLIDDDVYDSYQKLGISHLFALSGMHVGLLSSIVLKLLKRFDKKYKYIIIDIILLIYGFIVLFPASIKRCVVFLIISNINEILKLNITSLKILLMTIFVLVIIDNNIIYDIGFIYSVCTVGGILYAKDFIDDINPLKSALKLSLVAFLFSMPISLWNYHEINVLSIIYNIFYVPFVSVIVYPLSLLSLIVPWLINIFNLLINLLECSVLFLGKINMFNIVLGFNIYECLIYYLFLLLCFYKKSFVFVIVIIFVMDIVVPYFDNNSYLYFFDVGQGDSSLIINKNRKDVVLIDTGGIESNSTNSYFVSDNVISFMKYLGIRKIDYLILTHGDFDHMGDANNYINNFTIGTVIFNCGEINELERELINVLDKKKIVYYSCIKELNINDNKMYFLQTNEYDNENDNSNVIYTSLNGYNFLFMGDAGVEKEKDILDKYDISNIDVLKVGHHGSRTSSSKELISRINPKYSIISVGKHNRYGHPNKEVLNNLKKSIIYRTDINGSIEFILNNNKFKIKTYNP